MRKTSVLSRRKVSGPFPAFRNIEIATRSTDDGPRNVIVGGDPTWPDIDLDACQKFLDDSGRESFLAEYQHDFSAVEERRVISEYDETRHVITWSEFEAIYGSRHIPKHWERAVGLDVGFTEGHISAWTWIATSAADSKAPGLRFRYRGMTFVEPLVDEMAEAAIAAMKPDAAAKRYFNEMPLIQVWRMSHEALSERKTLKAKHKLPFTAGQSEKTAGIHQWQHYLRPDTTKPHPFKPDEKLDDGYRLGRPSFYDIVDDDQLITPRDDKGLKLHREQVLAWRYRKVQMSESGLQAEQPVKAFEDTCDSTRFITAMWGPGVKALTPDQYIESQLHPSLQVENDPKATGWDQEGWEMARQIALGKVRKAEEKRNQSLDDPWKGAAPLERVEGVDPWGNWNKE